MNQTRDYLIVGQGLAGSALVWELLRRGKSVMVFDLPSENRASAVAAGLFNPITGRVMTKTWKAETIIPAMWDFYLDAEKKLNQKFLGLLPIYRPFISSEESHQWKERAAWGDLQKFVLKFHLESSLDDFVQDEFGGLEIAHSGHLRVMPWLTAIRSFLMNRDAYREEYFQEEELSVGDTIRYKDLTAECIIFCNGLAALQSSWFEWLPLKPLKGETLEITMEATPRWILNRGVYLVPSEKAGTYTVGATYQHVPFAAGTTQAAREELDRSLRALIHLPFDIIHQDWGIRPTTPDRRPILGSHPSNKNVIIFNGLGTKGVSLAPYFAVQLANWLEGKGDLLPEVNINRFKALYSK